MLIAAPSWGLEEHKPLEPERTQPKPNPAVPPQKEPPPAPNEDKVLVKALRAIRFVSKKTDVLKKAELDGVFVLDVPLLAGEDLKDKLKPFLGKPLTIHLIKDIAKAVALHCREQDRPFVNISVPEQDITKGTLQFLVTEGHVGQVRVEGEKWFRTSQYRSQIHLEPGDEISEKRLIEDIDYLNENPFRTVRPVFTPGKEPGTTDLVLQVDERMFPVRFYSGYEDSGDRRTGYDRILFGFNWNNAFLQGHEIGYQFTGDEHFSRLLNHSAYWRIPLPNRDKLAFNVAVSTVNGTLNKDFNTEGFNLLLGTRYIRPLPVFFDTHYRQDLQMGFDFKQTNNNLLFGGTQTFASAVQTSQFVVNYNGYGSDPWGTTTLSMTGNFSPVELADKQNQHVFEEARAGTRTKYMFGSMNLERTWNLPKEVTIYTRFGAQLTNQRLQSSEQMLLGGYNSVRGYDDRLASVDEGFNFSVELRSPNFSLGKIKASDQFEAKLQGLLFYDYAQGTNLGHYDGERHHAELRSIGVGARFRIGEHLSIRFDYGRQLREQPIENDVGNSGRIHLGVTGSF